MFFNSTLIYIATEKELHSLLKEKQQEVKTLTEENALLNSQLQEKEETINEQTTGTIVIWILLLIEIDFTLAIYWCFHFKFSQEYMFYVKVYIWHNGTICSTSMTSCYNPIQL